MGRRGDEAVPRHAFTVFVTGDTTRSRRAVDAFRALCHRCLGDEFDLTVVDVLVDPQLAEDLNVIATPTVVRTQPPPARRALGDLGDPDRVAAALGMDLPDPVETDGLA
jgi:circadian clock protein KaiB